MDAIAKDEMMLAVRHAQAGSMEAKCMLWVLGALVFTSRLRGIPDQSLSDLALFTCLPKDAAKDAIAQLRNRRLIRGKWFRKHGGQTEFRLFAICGTEVEQ